MANKCLPVASTPVCDSLIKTPKMISTFFSPGGPHKAEKMGLCYSLATSRSRCYSQASFFNYCDDEIREKSSVTLQMRDEISRRGGTFVLTYKVENTDPFFETKSTFIFVGKYQVSSDADIDEYFGVKLPNSAENVT